MMEIELEERGDVRLQGRPSHAMAVQEAQGKLVLARKIENCSDDTLEQFNILSGWLIVREKILSPKNGGIESVTFCGDILVTSHLNGSLTLLDPHSDAMRRVQICPSPLWSICALDSGRLAAVSHSATMFMFDCNQALVESSISLGVDTRLFSVATKGNTVAIGASDALFIVRSGEIAHSIRIERKFHRKEILRQGRVKLGHVGVRVQGVTTPSIPEERRLPTVVWCVCFATEDVVASGDSRGFICLWNHNTGLLVANLQTHQADVLSLCVTPEGNIWGAGVDPRFIGVKEITPGVWREFSKRAGKSAPRRDVKALAVFDGNVIGVGEDHDVFVARKSAEKIAKQYSKDVLIGGHSIVARGENYVDIYTTGENSKGRVEGTDELLVAKQPVYLARIYTPGKLPLVAYDLGMAGDVVALTDDEKTTVYRLDHKSHKHKITQLSLDAPTATAVKVLSSSLMLAVEDFSLITIPLEGGEQNILLEQKTCGQVVQLALSPDESHVAVITSRAQVFTVTLKNGSSRALRATIPIDIAFNGPDTLFVLSTVAGFQKVYKKVLYEFPAAGGAVRRVAPLCELLPSDRIHSLLSVNGKLALLGARGHWAILDTKKDELAMGSQLLGDLAIAMGFVSERRLVVCRLEMPPPAVAPFKLKKFGMM